MLAGDHVTDKRAGATNAPDTRYADDTLLPVGTLCAMCCCSCRGSVQPPNPSPQQSPNGPANRAIAGNKVMFHVLQVGLSRAPDIAHGKSELRKGRRLKDTGIRRALCCLRRGSSFRRG